MSPDDFLFSDLRFCFLAGSLWRILFSAIYFVVLAIAIAAICVSVFWCFRFEEGALNLFVCNACTSLGFRGRKRGVLVLFSANLGQSFFFIGRGGDPY